MVLLRNAIFAQDFDSSLTLMRIYEKSIRKCYNDYLEKFRAPKSDEKKEGEESGGDEDDNLPPEQRAEKELF